MEIDSLKLSVLTAMITPAVLISACGALILSTSLRLSRVVDRVRALSDRLEELAQGKPELQMMEERLAMTFDQLGKLTSRARILQRTLTVLYVAIGIFVATSVAIGVVAISGVDYRGIPVVTGLIGACFLFYGSVLLIFEARLAISAVDAEMDFIRRLKERYALDRTRWPSPGRSLGLECRE